MKRKYGLILVNVFYGLLTLYLASEAKQTGVIASFDEFAHVYLLNIPKIFLNGNLLLILSAYVMKLPYQTVFYRVRIGQDQNRYILFSVMKKTLGVIGISFVYNYAVAFFSYHEFFPLILMVYIGVIAIYAACFFLMETFVYLLVKNEILALVIPAFFSILVSMIYCNVVFYFNEYQINIQGLVVFLLLFALAELFGLSVLARRRHA